MLRPRSGNKKVQPPLPPTQLWKNVHVYEKFDLNLVTYQLQSAFPSEKYLSELSQTIREKEKAYLRIPSNIKPRSVL